MKENNLITGDSMSLTGSDSYVLELNYDENYSLKWLKVSSISISQLQMQWHYEHGLVITAIWGG